jgi:phosphopantothenoylcysteine decarboxylase / phosphopantothenate---cysteine ligase
LSGDALQTVAGRRVGVVVAGGIAAYKVAFVVRDLVAAGAKVDVVMTRGATAFVGPATFEALTGRPPLVDLFAQEASGEVDHVAVARAVELVLVAPATANLLAKMRLGLADDAASTVLLATRAPIVVAPAMNDGMWESPATRENVACLEARGLRFVGPEVGFLAEGYEAVGRMSEPEALLAAVVDALPTRGT